MDYPKKIALKDGTPVVFRTMGSRDREAVYAFFRRIPEEDRKFLKEDVSKPEVIDGWFEEINYARVLPLLAEVDGQVVADATLHRRPAGWLRHVGEIRLVVDPAYRRKGLGAHLVEELVQIAIEEGLEKLYAEVIAEERAAIKALERFGFQRVAVIPGLVKDQAGAPRDLVILLLNLATALLPGWYYF